MAHTSARPMPVLPLVGSTTTPPGLSFPARSASSIIASAMRSLTDPAGLACSILAQTRPRGPGDSGARIATRGVSPMRSSALSAMRSSEDIVFRKRHVHLVSEHLKAYAVTDAPPAPIDAASSDRARALHVAHPAIDLHADTLMWTRWLGDDLHARHEPPLWRSVFGGHVDLPRMRQGGVGAQFFSLVSLPLARGIRGLARVVHEQIDALGEAIDRDPAALRLARTAA